MLTVGVDIIEISRFASARFIDRAAEFFLSAGELNLAKADNHKHRFLASRFALKEAVIKAVPEPIEFYEFEIIKQDQKPEVRFLNSKFDKYKVAVSLSHSLDTAIGFAIVES